MVAHLNDAMRMATGELPVAPRKLPIRYFPLKQLILYVLPFPKSAPTAPELLARCDAADLKAEQVEFTRIADADRGQGGLRSLARPSRLRHDVAQGVGQADLQAHRASPQAVRRLERFSLGCSDAVAKMAHVPASRLIERAADNATATLRDGPRRASFSH